MSVNDRVCKRWGTTVTVCFWCCARRFLCSTTSPPRLSYPTRRAGAVTLRLALEEPAQQRGASGIDADQPVDWLANIRGGQSVVDESSPVTSILAMWSELTEATTLPDATAVAKPSSVATCQFGVTTGPIPESGVASAVGGDAHRDDDGVRQRFHSKLFAWKRFPLQAPRRRSRVLPG